MKFRTLLQNAAVADLQKLLSGAVEANVGPTEDGDPLVELAWSRRPDDATIRFLVVDVDRYGLLEWSYSPNHGCRRVESGHGDVAAVGLAAILAEMRGDER